MDKRIGVIVRCRKSQVQIPAQNPSPDTRCVIVNEQPSCFPLVWYKVYHILHLLSPSLTKMRLIVLISVVLHHYSRENPL